MLGRKAILHTARAGKRKWQLEIDKGRNDSDSEVEEIGADPGETIIPSDHESLAPAKVAKTEPEIVVATDDDNDVIIEEDLSGKAAKEKEAKDKKRDSDDEEDKDDEGQTKGGKSKQFAWMDSGDEASEDEETRLSRAGSFIKAKAGPDDRSTVSEAGLPSARTQSAGAVSSGSSALPSQRLPGPLADRRALHSLPPGVKLPQLSQAHLALMAQIASMQTLADLWELVDEKSETFAPAHASTALHKLTVLAQNNGMQDVQLQDLRLEDHSSFSRLRDRLDELLGTAAGRESFLPADLAMSATALAKVVRPPAREGAIGRIFADIADEAETRLIAEPLAFMPHMMSDLVWAMARSGNAKRAFLRAVVTVAVPRLTQMTCQDLANFAAALAQEPYDEAEVLLKGVAEQVQKRLAFSASGLASLGGPANATVPAPRAPGVQRLNGVSGDVGKAGGGGIESSQPFWRILGQWKFTGNQISEFVYAIAMHIGLYDEALFSLVAQQFANRFHEFNLLQLTKLRDAYELVRHPNQQFLMAARNVVKQRALRTICQAYRQGKCRFGDRCSFSHA